MAKAHEFVVRLKRLVMSRAACRDCSRTWLGENAQRNAMSHVRQTGHRAQVVRTIEIDLSPGEQADVPEGQLVLIDDQEVAE